MGGSRRVTAAALASVLLLAAGPARSHEVRPGYLELTALAPGVWDVLWKVPARGDLRLDLRVRLPDACTRTDPHLRAVPGAHVERWRARCGGSLVGGDVHIEGLPATRTDVLVRVVHDDARVQTVRLTPGRPGFTVEHNPGVLAVAGTYFGLGVEHILLGIDHLLFVLALLLLVGGLRRLVGAITAFTASHSLTLAAAALGLVRVPSPPVEAAIALSIVFVAAEAARGDAGLTRRRPWIVAFAFGLLHGLGFAGALAEIGLPDRALPVALACFNLGVEAGQLLFLAAALALLAGVARRVRSGPRPGAFPLAARFARPAAYPIGTLGAFWWIERTAGFFGG